MMKWLTFIERERKRDRAWKEKNCGGCDFVRLDLRIFYFEREHVGVQTQTEQTFQ